MKHPRDFVLQKVDSLKMVAGAFFNHTVDGSEILRSPVEVGSLFYSIIYKVL